MGISSSALASVSVDSLEPGEAMDVDHNLDVDPAPPPPPSPPTTPGLTQTGRPRRNYRLPRRFDDFLPESAAILNSPPPMTHSRIKRVILIVRDHFVTVANTFGIWRDYPRRPTQDPDSFLRLSDLAERPPKRQARPTTTLENLPSSSNPPYWPFPNSTIHGIMQWLNNGNTSKSESQMNKFVNNVILSPEFSQDHVIGFNAHLENLRLDKAWPNRLSMLSSKKVQLIFLFPLELSAFLPRPLQYQDFFIESSLQSY